MADSNFWNRVKEKAEQKNLTLKEIAERCKIGERSIYTYISANKVPKKNYFIDTIAESLGTTREYLLFGRKKDDHPALNRISNRDFAKLFYDLSNDSQLALIEMAKRLYDLENPEQEQVEETADGTAIC